MTWKLFDSNMSESRTKSSRLSLGIVAATVGYELEIFHEGIYASIIGSVILSSIIASMLIKRTCKN